MKKNLFIFLIFLFSFFSFLNYGNASSGSNITTFSGFLDLKKYENETKFILIPSMSGATNYTDYGDFYNITNNELLHIRYVLIFILFFITLFGTFYITNSIILGGRR